MDGKLKAIAAALNLRGSGSTLIGDYRGYRLRVVHVRWVPRAATAWNSGDEQEWRPTTTVSLGWHHPLDLGLLVESKIRVARGGVSGGTPWAFNDPQLRGGYSAWANDPERAVELFTPELCQALAMSHCSAVTDFDVTRETDGLVTDVGVIRPMLDALIPFLSLIGISQQNLPLARELLPLKAFLAECAAHFGLVLSRCPFMLYGQVHGCDVLAFGLRTAEGGYRLTARIPTPIDGEFTINAGTWRDRLPFWSGDIETGDDAFDRMFRVTADDETRVAAALDGPLRELMMDLHRRRALKIHEGMLSITFPRASDLASLGQDLERMVSCAKALAARMSDATTKNPTPYR